MIFLTYKPQIPNSCVVVFFGGGGGGWFVPCSGVVTLKHCKLANLFFSESYFFNIWAFCICVGTFQKTYFF